MESLRELGRGHRIAMAERDARRLDGLDTRLCSVKLVRDVRGGDICCSYCVCRCTPVVDPECSGCRR